MRKLPRLFGPFLVFFGICGLLGCQNDNPQFGACQLGDRSCAAPSGAQAVAVVCGRDDQDRLAQIQEPCPLSAQCDSGRCVPPAGAVACQRQRDCTSGQVCVPLVSSAASAPALATFCVPAQSAPMPPSGMCNKDSDCQSYRCLQHSQQRYCVETCQNTADCGSGVACQPLPVTLNGVQGTLNVCNRP